MPARRNRIFLGLLLIYLAGTAFLVYRVLADLDPRYRESAEESLVETSHLLAALVEQDVRDGAIAPDRLAALFASVQARRFEARIFSLTKHQVDLRAVVTDAAGRVLFDSQGRPPGADHSRWRDVALALRGGYGSRTTQEVAGDPASTVMHVAAPVRWQGRIVGAVSVGKPVRSFGQFVEAARRKTLYVGVLSAAAVLLLALLVSVWLVRPFGLVKEYVEYVRAERRLNLRGLARRAGAAVRAAFEEMRDVLAGRSYVADYVQTLTHELKSPLSAIRGASELLHEPAMPLPERARFLHHIERETQRIQEVVDRMMELTTLEARRSLGHLEPVALGPLLDEAVAAAQGAALARGVHVRRQPGGEAVVEGDRFLLRRALANLLDNAVDFSPAGAEVQVTLSRQGRRVVVQVRDHGPGIPSYARDKVFEKFYSLARPHSGRKSTGLGLSFVQRIAALHRGRIELANADGGGAVATLTLPRTASG